MNKLAIISISIFSFVLFTTHALACDNKNDLSASDFFYGESIDNHSAVINTTDRQVAEESASLSVELAASEFFYGLAVTDFFEFVKGEDSSQRTNVAVPLYNLITPEVFYGYTDVIERETPCANC